MRNLVLGVCGLFFVNIATAQLQLAHNPACADEAPYCRALTTNGVEVMGYQNGILYGWQFVNNGVAFYSSNTFNPETWSSPALGQYSTTSATDNPIEIVFGQGACSAYKYIYTSAHHVLRASSDWNFLPLPIPDLPNSPSNTAGRAASFAAANQGSGTRLFYGNYPSPNNVYTTPCTNDAQCPHAYLWYSDNCGNSWSAPYKFGEPQYHAQEVHAINVDPANPWNIYVTIDT